MTGRADRLGRRSGAYRPKAPRRLRASRCARRKNNLANRPGSLLTPCRIAQARGAPTLEQDQLHHARRRKSRFGRLKDRLQKRRRVLKRRSRRWLNSNSMSPRCRLMFQVASRDADSTRGGASRTAVEDGQETSGRSTAISAAGGRAIGQAAVDDPPVEDVGSRRPTPAGNGRAGTSRSSRRGRHIDHGVDGDDPPTTRAALIRRSSGPPQFGSGAGLEHPVRERIAIA